MQPLTPEQQQLVVDNLVLAHWVAWGFTRARSTIGDRDDFLAEAYRGLCIAAARYDPATGNRFSTYAVSYINGCIQHHRYTDYPGGVRVPVRQPLDRRPTVMSLDVPTGEDGSLSVVDLLVDDLDLEAEVLERMSLETLPPRLRQVLAWLAEGEEQQAIARRLGVSRQAVGQLLRRHKRRLEEMIRCRT